MRERTSALSGRFSLLAVTTLEKLLLSSDLGGQARGSLKLLAIEERPVSLLRALRGEPRRQARPAESARRAFRGSGRNHHRGRQLERDPRRRNLPRRARAARSTCSPRSRCHSSSWRPERRGRRASKENLTDPAYASRSERGERGLNSLALLSAVSSPRSPSWFARSSSRSAPSNAIPSRPASRAS